MLHRRSAAGVAGSVHDPRLQAFGARVWEQQCRGEGAEAAVQYLGVVEAEEAMGSADLIALLGGEVPPLESCAPDEGSNPGAEEEEEEGAEEEPERSVSTELWKKINEEVSRHASSPTEREEAMMDAVTALERLKRRRASRQPPPSPTEPHAAACLASPASPTAAVAVAAEAAEAEDEAGERGRPTAAVAPSLSVTVMSPSGAPPVLTSNDDLAARVVVGVGPPSAASRASATLLASSASSGYSESSSVGSSSAEGHAAGGQRGGGGATPLPCARVGAGMTMTAVSALVFRNRRSGASPPSNGSPLAPCLAR
jgi:hypothetical protein